MTWRPGLEPHDLHQKFSFPIYTIIPFKQKNDPSNFLLQKRYQKRYGIFISHLAVYAYDCTRMLIASIKKAGSNRSEIRKELKALSGYMGISGKIIWDNFGSNIVTPKLNLVLN